MIRWLAMPLVVLGVAWYLRLYLHNAGSGGAIELLLYGLTGGIVFCLGLAVAPSRRWWAVLPVAAVLLMHVAALTVWDEPKAAAAMVAGVGLVALGAIRTLRLEGVLPTTLLRWLSFPVVVVMLPWFSFLLFLRPLGRAGVIEEYGPIPEMLQLIAIAISVLLAIGLLPLRRARHWLAACVIAVAGAVYGVSGGIAVQVEDWIAGALGGAVGLLLFVPEKRAPFVETAYRWAAAFVSFWVVNLIGFRICLDLWFRLDLEDRGPSLLMSLPISLAAGASIAVATLAAGGRRGVRELAGVAALVWSLGVLPDSWGVLASRVFRLEWHWKATLLVLAGVVVGELVAWRLSRRDLRRVVPAAADRAQRYKGTASFEDRELDRKTFFGRDRESRSLLSLVLAQDLVVLFAKSGRGKTSLLNASVLEPLRERGFFPIVARLNEVERGTSGSVIAGVRAAVNSARSRVELVGGDEASLERFFATAELWTESEDLVTPVLVIDQFEELFTLHEPAERDRFIDDLAQQVRALRAGSSGAARSGVDLKIVLSLREDFLADLEELAGEIPGVLRHRFRLGPLSVANARAAIVGPAGLDDAAFDTVPFVYREKVLERILTFLTRQRRGEATVTTGEIEPVQLQLVCQYLEELVRAGAAGAGGEISDEDLGGEERLERVLESFYDRTLESIGQPWRRFWVRRLCEKRLISGAGRRLTQDGGEIVKKYRVPEALLRKLVDARLLRAEPRLGGTFYELSHDTLVEPIRRSRERRVRRIYAWGAGWLALGALLVGGWWLGQGRQAALDREEAAVVVRLSRELPSSEDALLALAEARLEEIETHYTEWERSSAMVAAMTRAAAEAATAHPGALGDRVVRLFDGLREAVGSKPWRAANVEHFNPIVNIEGGTFWMGSAQGDPEALDIELPLHQVTLSDFWIQEHEVTHGEYLVFDSSYVFDGDAEEPATVNWFEATAYAIALGGRLPTEAEWEYAARGGCESGDYCFESGEPATLDDLAWYGGNSENRVRVVKTRRPNQWGLYDIYGNVAEWCADPYLGQPQVDPRGPESGSFRVFRGGAWNGDPSSLGSAHRFHTAPENRFDHIGFRVVWSLPGER